MTARREFWCHPLVVERLREETHWVTSSRSPLWDAYDLWACPVYVDSSMYPGDWEFREDGAVVKSGNTEGWMR